MSIKIVNTIGLLFLIGLIESLNICGEWVQYEDSKCFKVLEQKVNEEEAFRNCAYTDPDSSLISIHSKDEQLFLNNLLTKYSSISLNAWIGMKYINASYNWLDRSDNKYSNWADDAIKDGTDPCVQMSLVGNTLGKWTDESCKKTALVVCQKKQVFTLNTLRIAFESMEKEMSSLKLSSSIPMGFLYTQLPNQTAPQELWPHMNWTEVTNEYSGLFFRAEGSGSLPFGQTQQANQSMISDISYQSFQGSYTSAIKTQNLNQTRMKEWITLGSSDTHQGLHAVSFFTTESEVRPKNTAVRIWKRIG